MLPTTRWHKGLKRIVFSDNAVGVVAVTLKHGFVVDIAGKPAHVWASDVNEGIASVASSKALADGTLYAEEFASYVKKLK